MPHEAQIQPDARPVSVVAMSGGVDSSVAAARLLEAGHEVIGVTMSLADDPDTDGERAGRTCCAPDDVADARRVARTLDIAHYVTNDRALFEAEVIDPFVRGYAAGTSPNPCVLCNQQVKFGPLLKRARGLGAEVLATGHYARIEIAKDGTRRLLRGVDREKDQTYFLYGLDQAALRSLAFPLGDLTKAEVRELARRHGLATAEKPESQEICFVGTRRYDAVVEARLGPQPGGDIVDETGEVLGQHEGIHRYTVGQRKGLGVSGPRPLYVLGVDASARTVTVGERAALLRDELAVESPRWVGPAPEVGDTLSAQLRHGHPGSKATVVGLDAASFTVRLETPEPATSPGQAIVLYDGEVCLGGGVLKTSRRASSEEECP